MRASTASEMPHFAGLAEPVGPLGPLGLPLLLGRLPASIHQATLRTVVQTWPTTVIAPNGVSNNG
jgi:hypothetical protein